jgi:hypothetical protein
MLRGSLRDDRFLLLLGSLAEMRCSVEFRLAAHAWGYYRIEASKRLTGFFCGMAHLAVMGFCRVGGSLVKVGVLWKKDALGGDGVLYLGGSLSGGGGDGLLVGNGSLRYKGFLASTARWNASVC